MDSAKDQLAERLQSANNILVTVSRNPSVDQLAACLGLTLLLNKLNKHSVAVFSGQVPSTLEFLQPEETIEKNTDSLRDFIIALDKDKADKLRYKVEDNVVRIFITPYKTSISEKDLEFSQGDFNVDVVVALGVKQQEDLDGAITAHGRILHDATVASVNLSPDGGLGTINWHDPQASSLSELVTELALSMGDNLLDNQIATALLTGIVAETKRFSNERTSSQTMSASSALMAAGANQQLVATKLEEPAQPAQPASPAGQEQQEKAPEDQSGAPGADGTLSISHEDGEQPSAGDSPTSTPLPPTELPEPQPEGPVGQPEEKTAAEPPQIPEPPKNPEPPKVPEPPQIPERPAANGSTMQPGSKLVTEPPVLGGTLSANTRPESLDPVTDPFSLPKNEKEQLLDRSSASQPPASGSPQVPPVPAPQASSSFTPPPASWTPPSSPPPSSPLTPPPASPVPPPTGGASQTLSQIEQSVNSPHVNQEPPANLDSARDEVQKALVNSPDAAQPPIQALNSRPLGDRLHDASPSAHSGNIMPPGPTSPESADTNPIPQPPTDSLSPSPQLNDPQKPPPVPPPLFSNPGKPPAPPAL